MMVLSGFSKRERKIEVGVITFKLKKSKWSIIKLGQWGQARVKIIEIL